MYKDKLRSSVSVVKRKNIFFLTDEKGSVKKYRSWSGDIFFFLYDIIMERSVFPGKFRADIFKHYDILKKELGDLRRKDVLEIATGGGNTASFLNSTNRYTGIDISAGLLRVACRRFREYGFKDAEFYNVSAENLPFRDHCFDFAICNLSMHFFRDIEMFVAELKRVLIPGSLFFCSVPVVGRKPEQSRIRGTLYPEKELKSLFEKHHFRFESKPYLNGALLYFSAIPE
jgi:SAM-dependent methyltransferase